jgi:acryloyl-coenzyme A reductase
MSLPGTMRAAVLHETGAPDIFRIDEVATPRPEPNQIIVRVSAAGVSSHDVVERSGVYKRGIRLPLIPGIEVSGTVVAVGSGVTTFQEGDRVCTVPFHGCGECRLCRNGRETSCENRRINKGGYAEYVAVYADSAVQVPPNVDLASACMLGAATGVALNAVRDVVGVRLGESVLVTGASGGIGLPSIELAKLSGAYVYALTRSENKIEALREAGADEVVVDSPDRRLSDEIRDRSGGGVNVVIDTVGSPVFTEAFRSLASHGRYAVVGQLVGEEISINLARIFFKRISLHGVGSVRRDQLEDVVALVARGALGARIAASFALEDVADAHRLVEAGEVVGRVILTP